jgi:hypothetical protein
MARRQGRRAHPGDVHRAHQYPSDKELPGIRFCRISGGLGNASACLVASCCGSGRSLERLSGLGCEPGEAGDDASALEQPTEVEEPRRLPEARTGHGYGRQHAHGGADAVKTDAVLASPRCRSATRTS